jgi:very-short-patch-repair endonuclease
MRAPERTFVRAQSLRRSMSLPEVILWQHLRGQRLGGLRFRRQHPVGPYVLDFYCAAAGLAVEVDGRSHESRERARHDAARAAWLAEHGIRQLRLPAPDILDPARRVFALEAIVLAAGAPSTAFGGPPPPLCGGG